MVKTIEEIQIEKRRLIAEINSMLRNFEANNSGFAIEPYFIRLDCFEANRPYIYSIEIKISI